MSYQDDQVRLAALQAKEEEQRRAAAINHKMPCVPWRGAGGEVGRCIYCGKVPDEITQYDTDLANGPHADKTP